MAKILVTSGVPTEGLYLLKDHEVIIPEPCKAFPREELQRLICDADVVLACTALDGETIRKGKKLKHIANYGAGYNSVDIQTAAELGIPVTNIPHATADATAETTIALMLDAARRVSELNMRLRTDAPENCFGFGKYMGMSLFGKTLGIIGVGHIGKRVAEIAKVLKMRVIGYNRHGVDPAYAEGVDMETLLKTADVVALCCPLTPETTNLLSRERIAMMKPGAIVVNTARGPVVDNEALAEALKNGHLRAAGIDVYPDEPHVPAYLLELPQVCATPHIGTNTVEARFAMAEACCRQILDVLDGKRPTNIVNGI